MQNITPTPSTPESSYLKASKALDRLRRSTTAMSNELGEMPIATPPLLEALRTRNAPVVEQEKNRLLSQLDEWWRSSDASGLRRRERFAARTQTSIKDELTLKCHEGDLAPDMDECLIDSAAPANTQPKAFALYVMLDAYAQMEIRGALVMTHPTGRTLLALPGIGLSEFQSQPALQSTLAEWLNDDELREALLMHADQRHQDAIHAIASDRDVFLEPFTANDVCLYSLTTDPYRHSLQRLLEKQRADVIYACDEGRHDQSDQHAHQLAQALRMTGLLGPGAMLERRESRLMERQLRAKLPHWIKIASAADLQAYIERLKRYDQAREALASALNGATSADRYAQVQLRARLANDLGLDLDPARVTLCTRRNLPVTGEPYSTLRTLPELALYGAHPDDEQDGSAFLTSTELRVDGDIIGPKHAALTLTYIVRLINEMQLRASFSDYQRAAYQQDAHQALMRDVLRLQIAESALAAKMQGHLTGEDLAIIETLSQTEAPNSTTVQMQQLTINGIAKPGLIVLFRKNGEQGALERLIMFTADAPADQSFYSFRSETQCLEALTGWSARPEMRDYLLNQLPASQRPSVRTTLQALDRKPHPDPQFVQITPVDNYSTALRILVERFTDATLSNLDAHTPDWYLQASAAQRQQLIALEDAASGAQRNYESKAHTHVLPFEDYVHQRASEKICQLLSVPLGTVNPDQIIITSERETVSYTRLIRDGYDDSLGFLNPAADTVATFSGPDGVDLSRLTPAIVAGSVRGKWLADSYTALIKRTLLDPQSTGYYYRRRTCSAITRLQMQGAALRSLMKGHIDAEQHRWLETIIVSAHRSDTETRTRYPIFPLQIHIDKPFIASHLKLIDQLVIPSPDLIHIETVQGCYVLLPTETRHTALLYTPEAPDGVEFRQFSSFVDSLSVPGMIDYYKDRCRIQSRRILSFFLNDMKRGNANKRPFLPKDPITDFAQVCFNRPIERKLRDVADTTTSRSDMLSQLIWSSVELIATALTLPFPPASFAVGVALSFRDGFFALRTLTGASPEEANALILASIFNMTGAAGDFSQGLKGLGGTLRKLGKPLASINSRSALNNAASLKAKASLSPVELQGEAFFMGKANANGHAQVYHNAGFEPDDAYPTGHYAAKDSNGTWQPVEQASPTTGSGSERAVSLSLEGLPRATEGHGTGVCFSNGKCYIELNGLTYQVHYDASLRTWYIVDPNNPFAFFGRQPVRLDDHGRWVKIDRAGLRGGMDTHSAVQTAADATSATTATRQALQAYELPEELQPYLNEILMGTSLNPAGPGLEEFLAEHYQLITGKYSELRENLYRDARAFFSDAIEFPPRPELPTVDASSTFDGFLQSVYSRTNGLFLSEAPMSITSKKLLIDHMQTLVEQRVEVLYLPHLFTDKHLRKLAKYYAKGRRVRSGSHELKSHLKYLNNRALDNLSREHDYYHLIKQAHRHGIEVRPLSSSISYPVHTHPVMSAAADPHAAQKMSNYFGHKLIDSEQAGNPPKRWIALVDPRMATTHDDVPGLAQLNGNISVQIEEVPGSSATRIHSNPRLIDTGPEGMCDFRIEVADPALNDPSVMSTVSTSTHLPVSDSHAAPNSTPAPNTAADTGFRWDESSGWRRVSAEHWLAEHPPTAVQQSMVDPLYDMPIATRDTLYELAYLKHKGLDSEYFSFDDALNVVEDQFYGIRARLRDDARRVLRAELPPRPPMPALEPQPDHAQFIQRLYQRTDGMVIGEFHASIGSKRFIIDNLPLLVQQQVKTLYMEHLLTDLHQLDLDRFFETGQMTKRLLRSLKTLDRGHVTDPAKIYNFEQLVIKAREHGIEVRAIDCTASYHLKGLNQISPTTRQQMMSYFASRTIERHQAVMGQHKWIALVGNSHANRYQHVPGLAELRGAIGVRFDDVPPGTSRGVLVDPGNDLRLPMSNQTTFVKSDFMVEIEVTGSPLVMRAPMPLSLEQRLSRPGLFVTEREAGDLYVIVHRSRDGALHRTPVQLDSAGKVFVDRPSWVAVHLQPFNNIDALVTALEDINLTRVG